MTERVGGGPGVVVRNWTPSSEPLGHVLSDVRRSAGRVKHAETPFAVRDEALRFLLDAD